MIGLEQLIAARSLRLCGPSVWFRCVNRKVQPSNPQALIVRDMIETNPFFRRTRERFDFEAVSTVETSDPAAYLTAKDYALSDQMQGRVRFRANMRDDRVLWSFEFEEDAILFCMRFAASLPKVVI